MTTSDASEWIRLICQNATELRAAGVTRIAAGGCEAEIAPEAPLIAEPTEEAPRGDALDDPETFGGVLPKRPPRH